ncbi:TonB-dependent receptor domain-containing protein [Neokomagataea tanensis]|uniref:TonB-dependent receptor domain-containing protein n=1 Tax=Neokomagataea TaxID=1223423 RepID=UPI001F0E60E3|nr:MULTISPECIES: TonB-dependent receptor [Neokomagataea]
MLSAEAAPVHKHQKTAHAKRPVVTAPAKAMPTATPVQVTTPQTTRSNALRINTASIEEAHTENVVVTGSMFRDPNIRSASPITRITAAELQQRGIHNVSDALQLLSSNGAGNLTNAWTAGGGFAPGSSAPSLRGLSTDSTLVLMDGQRLSYYPLADDGERNFVDTNWFPSSIMQTIDVMQDGGSATYGADAVAGVVNYITRKQIKGFEGNAEGGLSQRGDAGHQKLYATYGFGDLDRDKYNVYVNSEYQQDDPLYYRQLQGPYNNGDLTSIGGSDGNINSAIQGGQVVNVGQTVPSARAVTAAGVRTGPLQLINQAAGCTNGGLYQTGGIYTSAATGDKGMSQVCSQNAQQYAQIAPSLRRINATIHGTVNVTDQSQLVAMFNYSQVLSQTTGAPASAYSQNQAKTASTLTTFEPVLLPNGQLNPSNPYAAQNERAWVYGQLPNIIQRTSLFSQNFRGSVRYSGFLKSHWGSDWNYDANFVGMHTTLQQTYTGVPKLSGLIDAISTGSYNFANPSATPQSVLNSIAPVNQINALTKEYSLEGSISKGLFHLPGGMLHLAIGGNVRYEYLNDPNANPADLTNPANQWTGAINPVSAYGHRWVESGFFEVNAPIVKMLNADVSGRYDHYSEGFSHFSPKVGVQFKPSDKLTLRGTFSKGFRVPSFAETGGTTIGYTGFNITDPTWLAQHTSASGLLSPYAKNYSLGLQNAGNPSLRPETSTNFSGGPVFTPTKWLTLTATYYYIKKDNYITPGSSSGYGSIANQWAATYAQTGSLAAANATVPAGTHITANPVDTQFPNGAPSPAIVSTGYVNARSIMTDGFDLGFQANTALPGILHNIHLFSDGHATYVRRFNLRNADGTLNQYAGTIGPYQAVSSSGTPRWRANWQNTLTYKSLAVTPTVYYTSGYRNVADDYVSGSYGTGCANMIVNTNYLPGRCTTKGFWDVDLTVNYTFNKNWRAYANVYNLLGFRAPIDTATYSGYLYNSSWTQQGVILRSFQFGVLANF